MKPLLAVLALTACAALCAAPAGAQNQPLMPAPASSFQSGSLHVDVYGSAGRRALIFIPGLTCGPWEWSREIASYAKTYTVYALTLPGFDGQKPIAGPLFDTVAADFWSFLSANHIEKPVLIGHSLGGTLGWMLASQHSERLGGVIAVDGLPVLPGMENETPALRAQQAGQMQGMMAQAATPAQFEAVERTYVIPYMVTSKSDVAEIAHLAARSDAAASGAWMAEDMQLDLRPQLKNISVPVLEIAPFDPMVDARIGASAAAKQAYYGRLLANDPSAKVEVIAGSRHFIMYDRPQQLDEAIGNFLRSLGV